MTNEEAIEILEESLRQNKVIQESPNTFFKCADVSVGVKNAKRRIVALNMAISALHAKQIPAKLDRSRWNGCDCCKGDLEGYTAQFRDVEKRSRPLYIPEGEAMIVAPGKYNHRFCIPIKYCPFCGRPLTEEAWAELEKRIGGL